MNVIIVGAGPSGLYCAIEAARNNNVIIIDKNSKVGRKLYISGKGRCNVTNNCTIEETLENVISNPKFLYSALNHFNSSDTISFFESNGVPLVTERGNRVFPKSYKSSDIIDCLYYKCKSLGVKFNLSECVTGINKIGEKFHVKTDKESYDADCVVIATGGLSYPKTGSTGDGYDFAIKFGHSIIDLKPALCAINVSDNINLNGLILKNVSLTASLGKSKITEFGELHLYKNYLDGPIALTLSSLINRANDNDVSIELDLKPALSEEQLSNRIKRDINVNPSFCLSNLLRGLMPKELISFFLSKANLSPTRICSSMRSIEIDRLVKCFKHFHFKYSGLAGYERAVVTAGGICTKEIDPKTMESKIIDSLYLAGEVVDVDAFTGGFNIQLALSTGALAGYSIAKKADIKTQNNHQI